ncbi:protein-L-isoaspartate O-methyltransferase [Myceligenerans crystallogenes]
MADDAVARAMQAVPRTGFLPQHQRPYASADHPLPIGHGQTSSQPRTVADMLALLRVPRGARILDVGAGSGWTTALLAHLAGPQGEVLGVERHPELAGWAAKNVAATGMGWAAVETADPGVLGRPRPGGWDRILVSAQAVHLPDELVDQLAPGGLMVIPVRGRMLLVENDPEGDLRITEHGGYRFVPLVED